MKTSVSLIILLMLGTVTICCTKNNDPSKEKLLQDWSKSKIKGLMAGKWQIHYSDGGYTGYTPCNNCFWEITASDTLRQLHNGNILATNKITYEKNDNGVWWMKNDGSIGTISYLLYSLKNDTLITNYAGAGILVYLTKL